jgi:signal transduction histidine kinase
VRAINGFAQLLATHPGAALDDEGTRLLGNIIRSSAHMGRLIDDLLTFAQLGRSAIDQRPVTLGPIVERIVEELRPQIEGGRRGHVPGFPAPFALTPGLGSSGDATRESGVGNTGRRRRGETPHLRQRFGYNLQVIVSGRIVSTVDHAAWTGTRDASGPHFRRRD